MALPPRGKNKEFPTIRVDLMLPMTGAQFNTFVHYKLIEPIMATGSVPGNYLITAEMDSASGRITLVATPKVP
jgi:hypothetical protein